MRALALVALVPRLALAAIVPPSGLSYDAPPALTTVPSMTAAASYAIDPTLGNDTSCNPSCASMAGALAKLPATITYPVTLTIADGSYTVVGATWFGDLSRFSYGTNGVITLKSSSQFTRAATTTTYTLSAGATQGATFGSDPGFTADTYKGFYLRVVSGTGAGSIAVVTTHTTTAWAIAGTWSGTTPGNSSVVEILQDSAILTFSDAASTRIQWMGGGIGQKPGADTTGSSFSTSPSNNFVIDGVGMTGTNATIIDILGLRVAVAAARLSKIEIDLSGARLMSGLMYSDGASSSSTGVLIRGGSLRFGTVTADSLAGASVYLRRFTVGGIRTSGTADYLALPQSANLFDTTIESSGQGIQCAGNASEIDLSVRTNGTNNTAFGLTVDQGCQAYVTASASFSTIDIAGSTGAIRLDGVTTDWAEVSGDATQYLQGGKLSVVGLPGTTTGTAGPLLEKVLKTRAAVDWNTTNKTTLYTVPAGKTAVFTRVVVRVPSTSLTTASCGFGRDASAADFAISATHTGLTGATLYQEIFPITTGAVLGAAGDAFGTKCSIAQGGAATVTIDVYGYLY